jgi:hypothetical protein
MIRLQEKVNTVLELREQKTNKKEVTQLEELYRLVTREDDGQLKD